MEYDARPYGYDSRERKRPLPVNSDNGWDSKRRRALPSFSQPTLPPRPPPQPQTDDRHYAGPSRTRTDPTHSNYNRRSPSPDRASCKSWSPSPPPAPGPVRTRPRRRSPSLSPVATRVLARPSYSPDFFGPRPRGPELGRREYGFGFGSGYDYDAAPIPFPARPVGVGVRHATPTMPRAERLERERVERERVDREREEREREERDRDRERAERERTEDRQRRERSERERLERERLDREKTEKTNREAVQALSQQRGSVELERRERERADRLWAEVERVERERVERERLERAERERLERERLERERLQRERVERERLERIERERVQRERLERERAERERVERERERAEAREKLERERLDRLRLEREREREMEDRAERLRVERLERARLTRDPPASDLLGRGRAGAPIHPLGRDDLRRRQEEDREREERLKQEKQRDREREIERLQRELERQKAELERERRASEEKEKEKEKERERERRPSLGQSWSALGPQSSPAARATYSTPVPPNQHVSPTRSSAHPSSSSSPTRPTPESSNALYALHFTAARMPSVGVGRARTLSNAAGPQVPSRSSSVTSTIVTSITSVTTPSNSSHGSRESHGSRSSREAPSSTPLPAAFPSAPAAGPSTSAPSRRSSRGEGKTEADYSREFIPNKRTRAEEYRAAEVAQAARETDRKEREMRERERERELDERGGSADRGRSRSGRGRDRGWAGRRGRGVERDALPARRSSPQPGPSASADGGGLPSASPSMVSDIPGLGQLPPPSPAASAIPPARTRSTPLSSPTKIATSERPKSESTLIEDQAHQQFLRADSVQPTNRSLSPQISAAPSTAMANQGDQPASSVSAAAPAPAVPRATTVPSAAPPDPTLPPLSLSAVAESLRTALSAFAPSPFPEGEIAARAPSPFIMALVQEMSRSPPPPSGKTTAQAPVRGTSVADARVSSQEAAASAVNSMAGEAIPGLSSLAAPAATRSSAVSPELGSTSFSPSLYQGGVPNQETIPIVKLEPQQPVSTTAASTTPPTNANIAELASPPLSDSLYPISPPLPDGFTQQETAAADNVLDPATEAPAEDDTSFFAPLPPGLGFLPPLMPIVEQLHENTPEQKAEKGQGTQPEPVPVSSSLPVPSTSSPPLVPDTAASIPAEKADPAEPTLDIAEAAVSALSPPLDDDRSVSGENGVLSFPAKQENAATLEDAPLSAGDGHLIFPADNTPAAASPLPDPLAWFHALVDTPLPNVPLRRLASEEPDMVDIQDDCGPPVTLSPPLLPDAYSVQPSLVDPWAASTAYATQEGPSTRPPLAGEDIAVSRHPSISLSGANLPDTTGDSAPAWPFADGETTPALEDEDSSGSSLTEPPSISPSPSADSAPSHRLQDYVNFVRSRKKQKEDLIARLASLTDPDERRPFEMKLQELQMIEDLIPEVGDAVAWRPKTWHDPIIGITLPSSPSVEVRDSSTGPAKWTPPADPREVDFDEDRPFSDKLMPKELSEMLLSSGKTTMPPLKGTFFLHGVPHQSLEIVREFVETFGRVKTFYPMAHEDVLLVFHKTPPAFERPGNLRIPSVATIRITRAEGPAPE